MVVTTAEQTKVFWSFFSKKDYLPTVAKISSIIRHGALIGDEAVAGSMIAGTVTHTVKLGHGHYRSPLTITPTGDIAPSRYGADGIDGGAAVHNASIDNDGLVTGGASGNGLDGGIGIDMRAPVTLTNAGTISGGAISANFTNDYDRGGNGVDLAAGGSVTNTGLISGGGLGNASFFYTGGAGGVGVDLLAGGTVSNAGQITGGGGGYNYHDGSAGGAGVQLSAGGTLSNTGTISGGQGGYSGLLGTAGVGGTGVVVLHGGFVDNSIGTIIGGAGEYANGPGGAGVSLAGGTLLNGGTITGGAAGYSYGYGAKGGSGVDLSAGATLINTGAISGGDGIVGHFFGDIGGAGAVLHDATLVSSGTITGGNGHYGLEEYGGRGGVGVFVDGGTLVASGTIAGGKAGAYRWPHERAQANAVRFGSHTGTLVIDPGAVFNGLVLGQAGAGDALVLAGTASATLSGLGTEFRNFASLTVESGAAWKLAGHNSLPGGATLLDNGMLAVTGTLADSGLATVTAGAMLSALGGGQLQVGQVDLAGGVLKAGDQATLAIGATLTGVAAGSITVESGAEACGFGTLAGASVIDDGTIAASGGTLALAGNVAGSGTIWLQSGGTLDAQGALGGVSVVFADNATLVLGAPNSVTSTLSGFGRGDLIDLQHLKADSLSFGAGTLTLMQGSTIVDRIYLAGSYGTANFALTDDGHGGSDIGFVASEAAAQGSRGADFAGLFGRQGAQPVPTHGELIFGWHAGEAFPFTGAALNVLPHSHK